MEEIDQRSLCLKATGNELTDMLQLKKEIN